MSAVARSREQSIARRASQCNAAGSDGAGLPLWRTYSIVTAWRRCGACQPASGRAIRMESNLFKYILRHSWRDQLLIVALVLISQVPYFLSLDLPKTIVNGPIQGDGFDSA
ncbi:MAG TPA: hypothetical protein VIA80_02200, partial [Hyphomonadaceae bacterium]